ncbi:MAG: hypothetical protein ACTSPB_26735 [Candidatus Thorarchaeota archaeon]
MKKCPYCAGSNLNDSSFCTACGANISSVIITEHDDVDTDDYKEPLTQINRESFDTDTRGNSTRYSNIDPIYYEPKRESLGKRMAKNYVRNVTSKIVGILTFFALIWLLSQCSI